MEYLKENWIIIFLMLCFLGGAFCFIMIVYLQIDLWIYKYKIHRRNSWYVRNKIKQESLTRKKQKAERKEYEKEQGEYYFRLESRKMILEEIDFIIPGFRVYKVKPTND